MKLTELRNIGYETEKKLSSINIPDAQTLKKLGSKEAFFRLKQRYPNVCLVHLYMLEGAIEDIDYNRLSEPVKRDLKAFSDSLKPAK